MWKGRQKNTCRPERENVHWKWCFLKIVIVIVFVVLVYLSTKPSISMGELALSWKRPSSFPHSLQRRMWKGRQKKEKVH